LPLIYSDIAEKEVLVIYEKADGFRDAQKWFQPRHW